LSRYQASLIHLLISALFVGGLVATVYWSWYPEPTFGIVGVLPIILMLVGVDLILGPMLTLIVYKHGKPGLKFDLSVIALVQIVALIYGAHTLYQEKPHYLVFVIDRLEFVSQDHIDPMIMRFEESQTEKFAGLVQVFARRPEDPEEFQRFFDSIFVDGRPDLERRPEYWEPWSDGADIMREQIRPIDEIEAESPNEQENLLRAIEENTEDHPNLGVLPVGGILEDVGMLVDRDTLEIIDVIYANPWPREET
jgi:hypothetical protein